MRGKALRRKKLQKNPKTRHIGQVGGMFSKNRAGKSRLGRGPGHRRIEWPCCAGVPESLPTLAGGPWRRGTRHGAAADQPLGLIGDADGR